MFAPKDGERGVCGGGWGVLFRIASAVILTSTHKINFGAKIKFIIKIIIWKLARHIPDEQAALGICCLSIYNSKARFSSK